MEGESGAAGTMRPHCVRRLRYEVDGDGLRQGQTRVSGFRLNCCSIRSLILTVIPHLSMTRAGGRIVVIIQMDFDPVYAKIVPQPVPTAHLASTKPSL